MNRLNGLARFHTLVASVASCPEHRRKAECNRDTIRACISAIRGGQAYGR